MTPLRPTTPSILRFLNMRAPPGCLIGTGELG
jgi:hypothetical protein